MIFCLHDTETTGLPYHFLSDLNKQPRIIEFAALLTDGNEIIDTMEFICDPGIQIEQVITDITGLTNEDLADKPMFISHVNDIAAFFKRADVIVAHNQSFDKSMLKFDLERAGLTLRDINWPALELCTVEQTRDQFGRRMKLSELYNLLVGEYVQKHRALDDVKLMHEVCQKIGLYNMFMERT